jgi:hypothetical protein
MNNIVMRKVEVAADYRPLSDKELVASVEISAPPTNSGPIYFLGDDGADVPWVPGEYHSFRNINLAEVLVKGTPGDLVTIAGGTW